MLAIEYIGSESPGCEGNSTVWSPQSIDLDTGHPYHVPWSTKDWIDRNLAEVNDEPLLHGDAGAVAAKLGMSAAQSFVREE